MKLLKMKVFAVSSAFVLTFALTMTVVPNLTSAQQWYEVGTPVGYVEMHEKPRSKGKLKCKIPNGEKLHQVLDDMISPDGWFVFVVWHKRLGTSERNWTDARGRWCPVWDRNGWVHRNRIYTVNEPEGIWIR